MGAEVIGDILVPIMSELDEKRAKKASLAKTQRTAQRRKERREVQGVFAFVDEGRMPRVIAPRPWKG